MHIRYTTVTMHPTTPNYSRFFASSLQLLICVKESDNVNDTRPVARVGVRCEKKRTRENCNEGFVRDGAFEHRGHWLHIYLLQKAVS